MEDDLTPEAILEMAKAGELRSSNDLKDFGAEMMGAIARKEVTVSAAREMRQWAELVYSLIQMDSLSGNGESSVNIIGQLVQMSGDSPKQIVEVTPRKQIVEEPLTEEDFFTEIVEDKAVV